MQVADHIGCGAIASHELQPGHRVFDRCAEFREVADSRFCRGHNALEEVRNVISLSQVITKEESAVLDDRTSEGAAELPYVNLGFWNKGKSFCRCLSLILDQIRALPFQFRVGGIQGVGLAVEISAAVEGICAGLIGGIDGGTAAAGFGFGNTGFYLKFLNSIWVWKDADGAELRLVVVHSVQREVVVCRA